MITVGDTNIKLQIWDTVGQQSFKSITRGYYRSAVGAILVYDITNRQSFSNVPRWPQYAKMCFAIADNKCNMQIDRKVSYQEGAKFARDNGLTFLKASAKTAYEVDEIYKKNVQNLLQKIQKGIIDVKKQAIWNQSRKSSLKNTKNQSLVRNQQAQSKKEMLQRKLKLSMINSCLLYAQNQQYIIYLNSLRQSIHFIFFPLTHCPFFQTPSLFLYVPFPSCFPFFHCPLQHLPLGQLNSPYPYFLSLTYYPSYFLPSAQTKIPLPCILLFLHEPSYSLPSSQIQWPNPSILLFLNYPSYLLPSAQTKVP